MADINKIKGKKERRKRPKRSFLLELAHCLPVRCNPKVASFRVSSSTNSAPGQSLDPLRLHSSPSFFLPWNKKQMIPIPANSARTQEISSNRSFLEESSLNALTDKKRKKKQNWKEIKITGNKTKLESQKRNKKTHTCHIESCETKKEEKSNRSRTHISSIAEPALLPLKLLFRVNMYKTTMTSSSTQTLNSQTNNTHTSNACLPTSSMQRWWGLNDRINTTTAAW